MHASTPDQVQQTITTQLTTVLANLLTWALEEPQTLAALEQQVLPLLQGLGQTSSAGCAQLQAPTPFPPAIACPCGQSARALRQRSATVITLLGRITIPRTIITGPPVAPASIPWMPSLKSARAVAALAPLLVVWTHTAEPRFTGSVC